MSKHDSVILPWEQLPIELGTRDDGKWEEMQRFVHVAWLLLLSIYTGDVQTSCYVHLTDDHGSLSLLSLSIDKSLPLIDHMNCIRTETISADEHPGSRNTMIWHGPVCMADDWIARHSTEVIDSNFEMVLVVHNISSADRSACQTKTTGSLHLLFNPNRFAVREEVKVGRIETLKAILSTLVTSPTSALGVANLLSDYDRRRILAWNLPVPEPPLRMTIPEGFAARVKESPDAPAVYAWDGEMTYHELDTASSSIAVLLESAGRSGPNDIVLFNMMKSRWALVGALAILKSGKAIVPIDPSWPRARLDQIVDVTGASLAVCDQTTEGVFDSDAIGRLILPPASGFPSASEWAHSRTVCAPDGVAFVLFSSGSTGVPKGMLREHGTACTGSFAHAKAMHLNNVSRVLQFANHVFDVAMLDFFTTLLMGACVCIPSESDRKNGLAEFIQRSHANWALLTPTVAEILDPSTVTSLEFVTFGGETIKEATLRKWLQVCRVGINYGSAEVDVTHTCDVNNAEDVSNVGARLPSCAAYIVDPENPAIILPVGAVGELVVSGPTMAREYLGAPAKTAEVFMAPPPLWLTQGIVKEGSPPWMSRIYRMGDLFRQKSDGSLEFVGRKDFQVKVNGQKVELSDIESKLVQHPAVKQCVVIYPDQGPYAKRLVAIAQSVDAPYQLSRHSRAAGATRSAFSLQSVTDFLSCLLPSFMLPAVLVGLQDMPYTPTMKIDRNRLKHWLSKNDIHCTSLGGITHISTALNGPLLPSTEHDAIALSCLIADILATKNSLAWKSISGHDNRLVDMGIDSAQMMRLASMIHKRFGVKILVDMLGSEQITVRGLATLVTSNETKLGSADSPPTTEERTKYLQDRVAKVSERVLGVMSMRQSPSRHVFLTGATGYLGVRMLLHLLRSSDVASVTVLVRSSGADQALQRVRQAIAATGASQDHRPSLHAWPGDLSKPRLGLSELQWSELSSAKLRPGHCGPRIDTIIHCGAVVDWIKTYDELEAANVTSTELLLKLTLASSHVRRFVFISGGRYPDSPQNKSQDAQAIYADTAQNSGYAQSKFVAEQLVDNVRRASHDRSIDIVCPAYLIGSREDGLANQDDYLWRIIWASVRVRAFVADEQEQWLFVAEADTVAERVVAMVLGDLRHSAGPTLKIMDGLSVRKVWDHVSSVLGVSLQAESAKAWLQRVRHDMDETSSHLLWPLADTLDTSYGRLTKCCCLVKDVSTDISTTAADLAIRQNLQHLRSVGFFASA